VILIGIKLLHTAVWAFFGTLFVAGEVFLLGRWLVS